MQPVLARRHVARPREELFEQLAHLPGHWRLAGRWVAPVQLRDDGGIVRVRGPLGLHRTIETTLTQTRAPDLVAGEARIGSTSAQIRWLLEPDGVGTLVTLRADVQRAGPVDRALLMLGGRAWLQGRFRATLRRLE